MMFRFIHAADLHLDTPFEGIGTVAPRVAQALRDASLDAWDALVELALEREVDALLIAGDVYDGAERGVRAQLRFRRGLERLSRQGVGVFVVHGNHDPLDGWSAIRSWPAGVHVFGPAPGSVPIRKQGRVVATVHGISYARRDTRENLAARLAPAVGGGLQIGLVHASVGSHPEHAPYSPASADELRSIGMDYWALGHVHRRELVAREPWIVYPGNLQGRSPKPSERGAKGALVVEVDAGRVREPEFVALDRARFAAIEVDIATVADLAGLRDRLADEAAALRREQAAGGLIVRAELTGRGALHRELGRPERAEQLVEDLRDGDAEHDPFVWWESVRLRTAGPIEREVLRRRGDFAASVIELAERLAGETDSLDRLLDQRFTSLARGRYGAALRGAELREPAALLRDAEALALDLLTGEEG